MIPRIDQLVGPVVVGRIYLVPTVTAEWYGRVEAWPVIGPQHNDAQCLQFEHDHYHLDAWFLRKVWRRDFWKHAFAAPLVTNRNLNVDGLPKPVWIPLRCKRPGNPELDQMVEKAKSGSYRGWQCHFDQWEGKRARHDGRGWVCPHRRVPLAGHPVVEGVITCPLHLLRIDAVTGRVLPSSTHEVP